MSLEVHVSSMMILATNIMWSKTLLADESQLLSLMASADVR